MGTEGRVITVSELLEGVQRACRDAQGEIESASGLPPLQTVSVNLATTLQKSHAIGAELVIISAEAKTTTTSSQEITVKFEKPAASVRGLAAEEINAYQDVVQAIKAAAAAAKAAETVIVGGAAFKSVTASVGFDVSRSKSGGLQFLIKLLKLGPQISQEKTASHRIDLEFERP